MSSINHELMSVCPAYSASFPASLGTGGLGDSALDNEPEQTRNSSGGTVPPAFIPVVLPTRTGPRASRSLRRTACSRVPHAAGQVVKEELPITLLGQGTRLSVPLALVRDSRDDDGSYRQKERRQRAVLTCPPLAVVNAALAGYRR